MIDTKVDWMYLQTTIGELRHGSRDLGICPKQVYTFFYLEKCIYKSELYYYLINNQLHHYKDWRWKGGREGIRFFRKGLVWQHIKWK